MLSKSDGLQAAALDGINCQRVKFKLIATESGSQGYVMKYKILFELCTLEDRIGSTF